MGLRLLAAPPIVKLQAAGGAVEQRGAEELLKQAERIAVLPSDGIEARLNAQVRVGALRAARNRGEQGEVLEMRLPIQAVAFLALVDGRVAQPLGEQAMAPVEVVALTNGAVHWLSSRVLAAGQESRAPGCWFLPKR
jgi:hypothetical protein